MTTRAAASNLMRVQTNWTSNFFRSRETNYMTAGGNGAMMRIQPHVWAARDPSVWESFSLDVIRNAICTHGHPRGIAGAVLHAVTLAEALNSSEAPPPTAWERAVEWLSEVPRLMRADEAVSVLWVSRWESESELPMEEAFLKVQSECRSDLLVKVAPLRRRLTTRGLGIWK